MDNNHKNKRSKTPKDIPTAFVGELVESEKSNNVDSTVKKKGFEQFADFLREFADDGQEDIRLKKMGN